MSTAQYLIASWCYFSLIFLKPHGNIPILTAVGKDYAMLEVVWLKLKIAVWIAHKEKNVKQ